MPDSESQVHTSGWDTDETLSNGGDFNDPNAVESHDTPHSRDTSPHSPHSSGSFGSLGSLDHYSSDPDESIFRNSGGFGSLGSLGHYSNDPDEPSFPSPHGVAPNDSLRSRFKAVVEAIQSELPCRHTLSNLSGWCAVVSGAALLTRDTTRYIVDQQRKAIEATGREAARLCGEAAQSAQVTVTQYQPGPTVTVTTPTAHQTVVSDMLAHLLTEETQGDPDDLYESFLAKLMKEDPEAGTPGRTREEAERALDTIFTALEEASAARTAVQTSTSGGQ